MLLDQCLLPFGPCRSNYTVQGQGLALLALGPTRPDPKRARVGPDFRWVGPALIGSGPMHLTWPDPGPTRGRPGTALSECKTNFFPNAVILMIFGWHSQSIANFIHFPAFFIVFDTGNPWVKLRSSLPVPTKTRIHWPWVRVLAGFVTDTGMDIQPVW